MKSKIIDALNEKGHHIVKLEVFEDGHAVILDGLKKNWMYKKQGNPEGIWDHLTPQGKQDTIIHRGKDNSIWSAIVKAYLELNKPE